MLTLTREVGDSLYLGKALRAADLEGTCDYRIDFDVVDHRVGHRRIEVVVNSRHDIQRHVLTPTQPDLDFAPDIRLAFLTSHEYIRDGKTQAVARIGVRAPRSVTIIRDNANPVRGLAA